MQACQHPRVPQRPEAPPALTCTQPLTQDPTQSHPQRSHTHTQAPNLSKPPRLTTFKHPEMGGTVTTIQPNALMGKLRPREKGLVQDSPAQKKQNSFTSPILWVYPHSVFSCLPDTQPKCTHLLPSLISYVYSPGPSPAPVHPFLSILPATSLLQLFITSCLEMQEKIAPTSSPAFLHSVSLFLPPACHGGQIQAR